MAEETTDTTLDIVTLAKQNSRFRKVVKTGDNSQVVLMSIPPGGEIGLETHPGIDQTLVFVEGNGEAVLDGETTPIKINDLTFVKAGTEHNFLNTGDSDLKLYTVYAPPEHPPGTVHDTKADADAAEADH